MMFGGQTGEAEALSIMDYCYDRGLNFWDTANGYTAGESEKIVGKALKGRRDDIFLATKVFYPISEKLNYRGTSRRHIMYAIDRSLKSLGTDYVDLYYLHAPDYETSIEETLDTMTALARAGKIRYIGVSNFASWQVSDILGCCEKHGFIKPVISQNIYNLLLRDVEKELAPCLHAHNMGIAVYNPIAGGLLTGKYKNRDIPANTRFANQKNYYERYWSEENLKMVDQFSAIAEKAGLSLLELALRWAINRLSVTTLVNGVSKLDQIKQNIAALDTTVLDTGVTRACDDVWDNTVGKRFAYNR
jgi:aryl-alcohol dehydrogenase-like predicted oxidoreductase